MKKFLLSLFIVIIILGAVYSLFFFQKKEQPTIASDGSGENILIEDVKDFFGLD